MNEKKIRRWIGLVMVAVAIGLCSVITITVLLEQGLRSFMDLNTWTRDETWGGLLTMVIAGAILYRYAREVIKESL